MIREATGRRRPFLLCENPITSPNVRSCARTRVSRVIAVGNSPRLHHLSYYVSEAKTKKTNARRFCGKNAASSGPILMDYRTRCVIPDNAGRTFPHKDDVWTLDDGRRKPTEPFAGRRRAIDVRVAWQRFAGRASRTGNTARPVSRSRHEEWPPFLWPVRMRRRVVAQVCNADSWDLAARMRGPLQPSPCAAQSKRAHFPTRQIGAGCPLSPYVATINIPLEAPLARRSVASIVADHSRGTGAQFHRGDRFHGRIAEIQL